MNNEQANPERPGLANTQYSNKIGVDYILRATNTGIWTWNIQTGQTSFNETWAELIGYTLEELEPTTIRTWEQFCHPEDLKKTHECLQKFFAGEIDKYESEFRLKHKNGNWIWILDQGNIIERTPDGQPLWMMGTHQNITERKEREIQSLLDEARLESLLKITQHPANTIQELLDFALEQAIELTNSQIGYIYFYSEEKKEFTLNSWSKEVMHQCKITQPKTIYQLEKTGIWGEAVRQRKPIIINDFLAPNEYKKGHPKGHAPLFKFLTIPVISENKIVAVVGVANKQNDYDQSDIRQLSLMMDSVWKSVVQKENEEKLKKVNRLYSVISQISQAIVHNRDQQKLFDEICRIIIEWGKFRMAWIGIIDDNYNVVPVAWSGSEDGYLGSIVRIKTTLQPEGSGPVGTAIRTNHYFVSNEIRTDEHMALWRDEALKRNYQSIFSVPIRITGDPKGALTIYADKPNFFNAEEIQLLTEVANDISYALNSIETEKKHIETVNALFDSENKFRSLVNQMQFGIAVHEIIVNNHGKPVDYRFIDINPSFERMTGLIRENVIGKTVLEILPNTEPIWIEKYGDVALTGEPISFENYSKELNRHYSVIAYRPDYMQFAVIFEDITQRKKDETLLIEEKLFTQTLIENLPGIFFLYTYPCLKLERWNKNHETILGMNPEELKNRQHLNLNKLKDRKKLLEAVHDIAENGTGKFETCLLKKDGSTISFLLNGVKLELGEKTYILGYGIDITDRKAAEEKLAKSENLFKAIMEQAPSSIEIFNTDGLQVSANKSFEELWKIPATETINKFNLLKNKNIKKTPLYQYINHAYNGESVQVPEYQADFKKIIGKKNGETHWLNTKIYPLKDSSGNVQNIIITSEDVSLKRAAEKVLTNSIRKFEILSQSGTNMLNLTSVEEIYDYLANTLNEQYPNSVILLSVIDEKQQFSKLRSIKGVPEKRMQQALKFAGFNFAEKEFALLPSHKNIFQSGKFTEIEGGLTGFTGPEFPPFASKAIEKLLGLHQIYTIGINNEEHLFATIHFFNKTSEPITDNEYIETFTKQASIVIRNKINEEAVRQSEEKYRLLTENASDVIWVLNLTKGKFTYISPTIMQLRGLTVDEAMAEQLHEALTPESLEKVMKAVDVNLPKFLNRQLTGSSHILEIQQFHKNKSIVDIEISSKFRHNKEGEIEVVGVSRNIEERKRMMKAIQESERKFHLLFENSPLGIYIADAKGNIEDGNQALLSILGSPSIEMTKQINVLKFAPLIRNGYNKVFEKCIHENKTIVVELPYTTNWGKEVYLSSYLVPVTDANGKVTQVYTLMEDITNRKRAEAALLESESKLRKVIDDKDKFFSIISHDLRSPFSSLVGLSEIMAEEESAYSTDDYKQFSKALNKTAQSTFDLLENLLAWSRVQQGTIPFNPQAIELNKYFARFDNSVLESATKKEVDLKFKINERIDIEADINMFNSILRNLILNAIKFSEKGGTVVVEATRTNKQEVLITVSDNGIGMNKELISNLFQPGANINRKGTNDEPSSGLGLMLCKDFVEKHGGKIWAESIEEKGSTFTFTIPSRP